MSDKLHPIRSTLSFLAAMTVLTGVAYPALLLGIGQAVFPVQANGSLISLRGQQRGSFLLAQKFESPRFFRPRPSASDFAYIGASPSNLGPTSAALAQAVSDRRAAWVKAFGGTPESVPADMLYSSGSGLDPDISLEAALAQVPSVAAARGLAPDSRDALVAEIKARAAKSKSLVGPERINVVSLNVLLESDPVFSGSGK